jgi:pectate lyase
MLLSLLLATAAAAQAPREVPAFPGAEGAGRLATGGRGGRVLRVANLDDSGPGSLRAAVEAKGPRTIIFDIGGTIQLKKPLVVRNGQVTIAGQTAPGGGITLRDRHFEVAADDVVVRFIRSRLGDEGGIESDAFTISRGRRIIVDHVSASWSVDETLSSGSNYKTPENDLRDVTVQWSIISESMRKSVHAKGEHGYGSLLRGGRGARMSFHHNLWAHHMARMPRPGNYLTPQTDPEGAFYDIRSNVFYNWGGSYAGYNADSGEKASHAQYNFIGNAYKTGPDTKKLIAFDERNPIARAWFAGNSMNGAIPADPWSLVSGQTSPSYRLAAPIPMPPVTTDPAPVAFERVLESAGASVVRDAVDERVVASVRSGTGKVIDSQKDVGGWPELAAGPPWKDSDGDGMPDDWERRQRLDPRSAADGNADRDGDGFTELEEWLNAIAEPRAMRVKASGERG